MILIEPGHGGRQSGCIRVHKGRKYQEKHYNLRVALLLHATLKKREIEAEMTRVADVYILPKHRRAHERQLQPNMVLSIHANSVANAPTAHGMQTYYWPTNDMGRTLAQAILDNAPTQLRGCWQKPIRCYDDPYSDRDDWIRNPKSVVGLYSATCVLVETGFFSNLNDFEYLQSNEGVAAVVTCLVDTLEAAYYGIA